MELNKNRVSRRPNHDRRFEEIMLLMFLVTVRGGKYIEHILYVLATSLGPEARLWQATYKMAPSDAFLLVFMLFWKPLSL